VLILVLSIVLLALSGAPALLTRGRAGEHASTALVLLGAAGGLTAAVRTLAYGRTASATAPWQLPNAILALRLDPLAAAFLLPIFVLGALASVYGLGYWPAQHQASAGRVRVFMGLLLVFRVTAPTALYPTTGAFTVDVDEPFADRILQPLAARWAARAMRLRWLQQGRLPLYLLYIFVTLLAGVAWVVVFPHVGAWR